MFAILIPMKPPSEAVLKRVYGYVFARVYPLYIAKAEKKGRTKEELRKYWRGSRTSSKDSKLTEAFAS